MGWLSPDGRFVGARCGSSNRCAWCAFLYAIETAQCVYLDAERGGYPRTVMTLTTVDPATTAQQLRRGVEQVVKAIRHRCPDCEYLAFVEWTSGRARKSGGLRRVHLHLLLKGVYAEDLVARPTGRWGTVMTLEDVVRGVWSERTGAHRVEVAEIGSPWAAAKYLTHHHNKPSQAPPADLAKGFKRLRPSKGYFGGRLVELRREVRQLEQDKRVRRAARALVDPEVMADAPDLPEEVWASEWRTALDEAKRAREWDRPRLVKRIKIGSRWYVVAEYAEGVDVGIAPDGQAITEGAGWSATTAPVARYRDLRTALERMGVDHVVRTT
ncbi:hypothetical protein [Patulibacter medicamentivorans]|nr:hypothetical protein [Patulibacter medicamentivorans]